MYVDAKLIKGRLWVNTRDEDHRREIRSHSPPYVFYYSDSSPTHHSIYGDPVRRSFHTNRRSFDEAITEKRTRGLNLFETDYNTVFRYLEESYKGDELPPLHATFFDIEVFTIPERGWPRPDNPYGEITALTVVNTWEDRIYTLMVPPPTHTVDSLRELFSEARPELDNFGPMTEEQGYYICESERELIDVFLELIEDTDVLMGWHSSGYDLPYIINRIRQVHGREFPEQFLAETGRFDAPFNPTEAARPALMKLCLFPGCLPSLRTEIKTDKFNKSIRKEVKNFHLHGRVHLDYKEMFEKFTLNTIGKLHSYSLDFVLRSQLGDSKLEFDGTLQQLYENNPRRYAAYNRQDTVGVARIDMKFKLVDLINQLAHMAGVTLDKTLGSTTIIEHAIMKQVAHPKRLVRADKPASIRHEKIPGAFVVEPVGGVYYWPASIDVQSLYPSCARMLNLSPETLVGQFLPTLTSPVWNQKFNEHGGTGDDQAATRAWGELTTVLEYEEIHKRSNVPLILSLSDGTEITQTAAEWYDYIRESGFALSGNATLFRQDERGIFSGAIDLWFDERLKAKDKAKEIKKKRDAAKDSAKKAALDLEYNKWDTLQMAFKIFMNSAYGASASPHFVFYDPRLGKSITLSGRVITKHMIRQVCKELTGNYDFDKNALIYGDTDSCYFKLDWYLTENGVDPKTVDKSTVIELANSITDRVNATFPPLLKESFFCSETDSQFVLAVRDIVAVRGLFKDKKKRYALWVIDKEHKPEDEIKIVGMETKRTSTPKYMQAFLEGLISRVLRENLSYEDTYAIVDDFRKNKFKKMEPWEHGSTMGVKNLDNVAESVSDYENKLSEGYVGMKKPTTSFAVAAAIATNKLIEQHGENRWDKIREGDGVEILYLLPNPDGYKTVALPVGATYIPEWFKALPFDTRKNQDKILDSALYNTVGQVLDWDFEPKQNNAAEVFEEKDFFS